METMRTMYGISKDKVKRDYQKHMIRGVEYMPVKITEDLQY